jgi:hypothetical protein
LANDGPHLVLVDGAPESLYVANVLHPISEYIPAAVVVGR